MRLALALLLVLSAGRAAAFDPELEPLPGADCPQRLSLMMPDCTLEHVRRCEGGDPLHIRHDAAGREVYRYRLASGVVVDGQRWVGGGEIQIQRLDGLAALRDGGGEPISGRFITLTLEDGGRWSVQQFRRRIEPSEPGVMEIGERRIPLRILTEVTESANGLSTRWTSHFAPQYGTTIGWIIRNRRPREAATTSRDLPLALLEPGDPGFALRRIEPPLSCPPR